MDPTAIYAICFGGLLVLSFTVTCVVPCLRAGLWFLLLCARAFVLDRFIVRRHAIAGPWTVGGVLAQVMYVGGNVWSLWFGHNSAERAATRAGRLALANAAPLFLSPHLSLLADLLGLSLQTCKRVHRTCGLMTAAHVAVHGIITTAGHVRGGGARTPKIYESVAAGLTALLLLLTVPVFRRRAYELFLRLHQVLALGAASCTVIHLYSNGWSHWPLFYAFGGTCGALVLFRAALLLYRNKVVGLPFPRLTVVNIRGSASVKIYASRPICVDAGQYLNIWVPSISWFSSHPFIVTSWSPGPDQVFELLIQRRRGFTKRLLRRAEQQASVSLSSRVLFSGPHGFSAPVRDFERVLFFASGFGIAAALPYLRKLVYGRAQGEIKARRVCLVWHVNDTELRCAVAPFVDGLLDDDRLEGSYMLYVSIYNGIDMRLESSRHGRFTICPGVPDPCGILRREAEGTHPLGSASAPNAQLPTIREGVELGEDRRHAKIRGRASSGGSANGSLSDSEGPENPAIRQPIAARKDERTLVLVSSEGAMRDQVHCAVRPYLTRGFELVNLDYQPYQ